MQNTTSTHRVLFTSLGIVAFIIVLLILPTPLHDWFVSGSIGPVPADVAVIAFIILFTPVTVLSSILRKFDVDYEDEAPAAPDHIATHMPM